MMISIYYHIFTVKLSFFQLSIFLGVVNMFYLMFSKTRHAELRLITGCISGMLPVALALLPSAVCMLVQNDVLFFFLLWWIMHIQCLGLDYSILFHVMTYCPSCRCHADAFWIFIEVWRSLRHQEPQKGPVGTQRLDPRQKMEIPVSKLEPEFQNLKAGGQNLISQHVLQFLH